VDDAARSGRAVLHDAMRRRLRRCSRITEAEMSDDLQQTVMAMLVYGGSFDKALAAAALRADPDNLRKLQEAFGDLFQKYADVRRVA